MRAPQRVPDEFSLPRSAALLLGCPHPIDEVLVQYAMIPALLKGKLSREQENMEDILTSCVFGVLRYMTPESGLFRFLSAIEPVVGSTIPLPDAKTVSQVDYDFWPILEEQLWVDGQEVKGLACEPDLILSIRSTDEQLIYVLIEAKFTSGKSSWASDDLDAPNDQLAREWDNLVLKCKRRGATPLLIYLTADFKAPVDEIRQSEEEYCSKRPASEFACSWLSWRMIPRLFREPVEPVPLQDLVDLCERLNLRYFSRSVYFEALPVILWRFQPSGLRLNWRIEVDSRYEWRYRG